MEADRDDMPPDAFFGEIEGYADRIEDGLVSLVLKAPDGEDLLAELPLTSFPPSEHETIRNGSYVVLRFGDAGTVSPALADKGWWTAEELAAAKERAQELVAFLRDTRD